MHKRAFLITLRLLFGTAVLIAIIIQAIHTAKVGVFNTTNYLSYFTNLSNIVAAFVLIISGLSLLKLNHRRADVTDDLIRGAATLYMVIVGIVYVLLLSNEAVGLMLPWVNILLHYIMPAVVLADWLFQPPRTKLSLRQTLPWFIFPLVYLPYTLIRGHQTYWYPYPFLNPIKVDGYLGVAMYCVAILAAFIVVSWGIVWLGNRLRAESSAESSVERRNKQR